jgi:hypothetical protein
MLGLMLIRRISAAFCDPNTTATGLLALVLDNYGTEALDWSFETLRAELEEDFNAYIPEVNADKLQAIFCALGTDQFYRDVVVFHHICSALDNEDVNFEHMEAALPEAMAWAVFEVAALDGQGAPRFTPEVCRYIGACLAAHGLHVAPETLRMADFPDGSDLSAAASLGDDPVLFNGFNDKNRSDAREIDSFVQEKFQTVMSQLESLPLQNRDGDSFEKLKTKLSKNHVKKGNP